MTILPEYSRIIKIESKQEWQFALQEAEKFALCALSFLTTGTDPLSDRIWLACIALPNKAVYIADCLDPEFEILGDLACLLENSRIRKVFFDAKAAISFIRIAVNRKLLGRNLFDLMLASQICWSGFHYLAPSNSPKTPWKKQEPDHSLAALADRHLGIVLAPIEIDSMNKADALQRSSSSSSGSFFSPSIIESMDNSSAIFLPIYLILDELLAKNELQRIADLEFRAICSLAEMEITGIYLDSCQAERMVRELEYEICRLVWTIQEEAKSKGFVAASQDGKKLSCYLNPEKQEEVMAYLNKRGYAVASTKAEVLRGLAAAGCGFAEAILNYRHASHRLAFLNNWLRHVHAGDGRVHPQYFQIPSSTGRISSRNPNAQQIPRAGEDAPAFRRLFLPSPGKRFVKADFSAIELRIMACLSGDAAMQEAFQNGVDLHRLTASKIGAVAIDQVTDSQRQAAKIMNFLLIYGGSARTLQYRTLSDFGRFIPLDEAEQAVAGFFQTYRGVAEWQERQIAEMSYTLIHHFHSSIQGFFSLPVTATRTVLGRRRIWPRFGTGIRASRFQMFNTPCQGTGADLIKLVMAEVYEKMSTEQARIIGSIHDEIVLEIPVEQAEEAALRLQEIMQRIGCEQLHPIPVRAEGSVMATLAG
jgi:DNA polymerase I